MDGFFSATLVPGDFKIEETNFSEDELKRIV